MNNFFLFYNNFCDLDKKISEIIFEKNGENNADIFCYGSENLLTKEKVIELQNLLSKKIDEKKFIIINDFQNLNKEVINSLLLFLEENYENIFFILNSNQENFVLDTIKSRCLKIYLPYASNEFKKIISENKISDEASIVLLKNHFFSTKQIKFFLDFSYESFNNFINTIKNNKVEGFAELLSYFKESDYRIIELFLYYWLYYFQLKKNMKKFNKIFQLIKNIVPALNPTLIFNSFISIIME